MGGSVGIPLRFPPVKTYTEREPPKIGVYIHVIRELDRLVNHESCARKIMEQLVDKYKDRTGGYTRLTKIGHRAGDAAPMVLIELV